MSEPLRDDPQSADSAASRPQNIPYTPSREPAGAAEGVAGAQSWLLGTHEEQAFNRARGEQDDPLIGRTVDRYRILGLIGKGGMGKVYRAEHLHMHRPCAFKVMRTDVGTNPEFVTRFQREAQATARFHHPNAVAVYDFGRIGRNLFFMALELLEGEPLSERLEREGAQPLTDVVEIALQVLDVLEAAHKAGIVHRDLKPDNIMLQTVGAWRNQVKVLDFGIAKVAHAKGETADFKTRVGEFFGTPEYASPEQCGGDPVDHRADIYAMGVILYELLTGRKPFEEKNPARYLAAHMADPPPPFAEVAPERKIPKAVEAVVMRCLEKRREDRFQTASELADALAEAAGYRPRFAAGEHGVELATAAYLPAAPRRRFAPWAALIFAVLAAAALGWWWQQKSASLQNEAAVVLRSEPTDASARLLDLKSKRLLTPTTARQGRFRFDALSPGVYRLRVEKPGYEPFERQIELTPGNVVELEAKLEPDRELAAKAAASARQAALAAREQAQRARAPELAGPAFKEALERLDIADRASKEGRHELARERYEVARAAFARAATAALAERARREAIAAREAKQREAERLAREAEAKKRAELERTYQTRLAALESLVAKATKLKDALAAAQGTEASGAAASLPENVLTQAQEHKRQALAEAKQGDLVAALAELGTAEALYRQAIEIEEQALTSGVTKAREAAQSALAAAREAGAKNVAEKTFTEALRAAEHAAGLDEAGAPLEDRIAAWARARALAEKAERSVRAQATDRRLRADLAGRLAKIQSLRQAGMEARKAALELGADRFAQEAFTNAERRLAQAEKTIAALADRLAEARPVDESEHERAVQTLARVEELLRAAGMEYARAETLARKRAELLAARRAFEQERTRIAKLWAAWLAQRDQARKAGLDLSAAQTAATAAEELIAQAQSEIERPDAQAVSRARRALQRAGAVIARAIVLAGGKPPVTEAPDADAEAISALLERLSDAISHQELGALEALFEDFAPHRAWFEALFSRPGAEYTLLPEPVTRLGEDRAALNAIVRVRTNGRLATPIALRLELARSGGRWRIQSLEH